MKPCQKHKWLIDMNKHRWDNSHRFNIVHRRTEESPVAEHFNGEGRTLADMTVVAIDNNYIATTHVLAKYWKAAGG